MKLFHKKLTFIGAGNMASAIIRGLLAQGMPAQAMTATGIDPDALAALRSELGIHTSGDNAQAVRGSDIVVLAVKPQQLREVCHGLREAIAHQPLIISIAAGVAMASIQQWLGAELPMVRCMPNTPAQCLTGASGLIANTACSTEQKALSEELFSAIGLAQWLDNEAQIHAVTALSGSGPAYIFYVIEAMEAAAIKQGLSPNLARRFAAQTAKGAAEMVLSGSVAPAQLKRNVMSPGGTTERAIRVLEDQGLSAMFEQAMQAAALRSEELAEALAKSE